MNAIAAIRTCFEHCSDLDGEADRPEFWWFFGFVTAGSWLLHAISSWIGGAFTLSVILPFFAVTVRRLHDVNRSGWWALVYIVPGVGWAVLAYFLVQEGDRPAE